MPLSPGQVLNNRYHIIKRLGQGGYRAVYKAWDTTFNLPNALKENIETTEAAQRQFGHDAKMLRVLCYSPRLLVIGSNSLAKWANNGCLFCTLDEI